MVIPPTPDGTAPFGPHELRDCRAGGGIGRPAKNSGPAGRRVGRPAGTAPQATWSPTAGARSLAGSNPRQL